MPNVQDYRYASAWILEGHLGELRRGEEIAISTCLNWPLGVLPNRGIGLRLGIEASNSPSTPRLNCRAPDISSTLHQLCPFTSANRCRVTPDSHHGPR